MIRSSRGFRRGRGAILAACGILILFGCAGTLCSRMVGSVPDVGQILCSMGACDETSTARAAHRLLESGSESGKLQAISLFRTLVRTSPASAEAWCNLGEALLAGGDRERARLCFERAELIGSKSPVLLLRVAGFWFRLDQRDRMLAPLHSILGSVSDYDDIAFSFFRRAGFEHNVILESGIGNNRRAGNAYLRFAMKRDITPETRQTWEWLTRTSVVEEPTALEYIDKLWVAGLKDQAFEAWTRYFRDTPEVTTNGSAVFNGSFEREPAGGTFDWKIDPQSFLEWSMDRTDPHLGKRALHFEFDGKENPIGILARQIVRVQRKQYQLEAFARSEGLSSDQGVLLEIIAPGPVQRVLARTAQIRGTTPWQRLAEYVQIPAGVDFIEIRVIRLRSLTFDNLLGGHVWIDSVALRPERNSTV